MSQSVLKQHLMLYHVLMNDVLGWEHSSEMEPGTSEALGSAPLTD